VASFGLLVEVLGALIFGSSKGSCVSNANA